MATTRERILAMPHVSSVSDERAAGDGIWVYYKDGFKSASDPKGALHQDHEDTWSELYAAAREATPCRCGDGCPKPIVIQNHTNFHNTKDATVDKAKAEGGR